MNRFAELLDRLAYEPGRNNKLRLITAYFRETPDPDRGYALAALTGALSFKHAKPGLIRDLIAARTDPVLFALSYDYVGDLSETVALMWPRSPEKALPWLLSIFCAVVALDSARLPPPLRGRAGERGGPATRLRDWESSATSAPPSPTGHRRNHTIMRTAPDRCDQ